MTTPTAPSPPTGEINDNVHRIMTQLVHFCCRFVAQTDVCFGVSAIVGRSGGREYDIRSTVQKNRHSRLQTGGDKANGSC